MIHKNSYTTTVHTFTGYSPAFLHYGGSISSVFDLYNPEKVDPLAFTYDYHQYISFMSKIFK